jgi:hypothetical protein
LKILDVGQRESESAALASTKRGTGHATLIHKQSPDELKQSKIRQMQ